MAHGGYFLDISIEQSLRVAQGLCFERILMNLKGPSCSKAVEMADESDLS